MKRTLIPLLLIFLLTACGPAPAPVPPTPTQTPVEEAAQPTPDAEPPSEEPDVQPDAGEPAPTLPANQPPSDTRPQAPDQPGDELAIPGIAEIAILRPGQYSKLVSPLRLIASFSNEIDTTTFITLYGEDGRVLAERKFEILPYEDPLNGNVIADLELSIEGMNEVGRLELKSYDQFGRLRALNSVNLILLSGGTKDRNYAPEDGERILQQIPFPGHTEVEGGTLFLSGLVRLTPTAQSTPPEPLLIHLVDEDGEIVAEGRASVVFTGTDFIGQYVAEIAYAVESPTPVLLTISIIEGRLQTPSYVRTFAMTLLP